MRMIVIAGFLAAASPARAADSNANANANRSDATTREQPQTNGGSAADRPICVRETRSESHIRREVCHTAREWRDLHGDDPDQG